MIDWSRIQELRDEIGADDFDDVVEIFLSEVEETIEKLDQKANAPALEQNMHFLKGAALNLGFKTLAEHCQVAESAAANGQVGQVDVDGVIRCYKQSRAIFQSERQQHFAA